jgi:hypothetical protein
MRKHSIFLCFISWLLFNQEIFAQKIEIVNKENYPLSNHPITILKKDLKKLKSKKNYPILTDNDGNTIVSQTNANQNGKWNKLLFQVDLKAQASKTYSLSWQKQKPIDVIKTSIRMGERKTAKEPVKPVSSSVFRAKNLPKVSGFQPYQTDGPTWENDKVGYRHYLDGRHAKDLFGKLQQEISPENVGVTTKKEVVDNYHVMEKWGRDILPVGNSVGIGGIAFSTKNGFKRIGSIATDTLYPIKKTKFKILTEGAIYSQLQITHHQASINNKSFKIVEKPAIWAASYAYENQVNVSSKHKSDENLMIGLPKVATDVAFDEIRTKKWIAFYTYDKQSYNKEYLLGLAIIVPAQHYIKSGKIPDTEKLSNSYFAELSLKNTKEPLSYFALGCWEYSNPQFKTKNGFESYLNSFLQGLNADVRINILD